MKLNFIPVITAVVPAVAVHVCYLLAAQSGHVPWCFPYIDSCTSISAVGRKSPESHLFRATIIPTAVFMMIYWRLNYEWFKTLNTHADTQPEHVVLRNYRQYLGDPVCDGIGVHRTGISPAAPSGRNHVLHFHVPGAAHHDPSDRRRCQAAAEAGIGPSISVQGGDLRNGSDTGNGEHIALGTLSGGRRHRRRHRMDGNSFYPRVFFRHLFRLEAERLSSKVHGLRKLVSVHKR